MKTGLVFFSAVVLVSCDVAPEPATSSEQVFGSEIPPFYNVYPNGTGPLTMEELQINIPPELDRLYTDRTRSCVLRNIEDLAAAAGDPETLDPASVAFLPTDGSWHDLPRYAKRLLLAQVVVSRAVTLC